MTFIQAKTEAERCPTCKRTSPTKVLQQAHYMCDQCGAKIDGNDYLLDVRLFSKEMAESKAFHMCSWKCFSTWMKETAKPEDFVALPYIPSDENSDEGTSFKAFKEILK